MGQCFLHGNGGNTGLQVAVGLTAPGNPREAMVWVKSDKAGRKYVFSQTEPEGPAEGLIWFRATAAGIITRADVYTGGAWAAADTYMYLSGTWVQIAAAWNGELFDGGNQYADHTGGWPARIGVQESTDPYLYYTAGAQRLIFGTAQKIDVTNFSKLHVIGRGRGDYTSEGSVLARTPSIGIASAVSNSAVTYAARMNLTTSYVNLNTMPDFNTECVLDLTSYSGEYYIACSITDSHTGAGIALKKVWMD